MHAAAKHPPSLRLLAHIRVRAVAVAAAPVAVLLLSLPPVAGASDTKQPGKRGVQPLWQGYPMNPGAGQIDHTADPKQTKHAQPAAAARSDGGGSSATVPLAATGGSLLLLAALGSLVAVQRRRAVAVTPPMEGAQMSRFTKRRSSDELPGDAAAESVVSPPVAEAAPAPDMEAALAGAGNFGEHVQSVLKAAEDAAARIIEEARAHAQEVREDAEREASARLDTARIEAGKLLEEAEQDRVEAHTAAAAVRAAAETDAARLRAEANEDAGRVRAETERDAAAFAEDAAARYDGLLEDTAFAEDRLRRLVGGLRDVANRLDDLLEPTDDNEPVDPVDEEDDEAGTRSLDEALDPGSSRAGATP